MIPDGQIVNQVLSDAGEVLSSTVVGDYRENMTFTGVSQTFQNGEVMKQYSYAGRLGFSQGERSLVYIIFDRQGNVVSTTVIDHTLAASPAPAMVPMVEKVLSDSPFVLESNAVPIEDRKKDD